jgi:hypothetical protein
MATFLELLTKVKNEARVKSSTDLDDWIKSVINELIKTHGLGEERYQLVVSDYAFTITTDKQSQFALPVGFAKEIDVQFSPYSTSSDDYWYPLHPRNQFRFPYTYGSPKWYDKRGANIHIFPYSEVRTGANRLRMTYRKYPTILVNDADILEVPELENTIVLEAVARVARYHKSPEGEMYIRDSQRANSASL